MIRPVLILASLLFSTVVLADDIAVGDRPLELVAQMRDGALKDKLLSCEGAPVRRTQFSIGHRGAPLRHPEHTVESYTAAAAMGAGIVECDVTFTRDKALVCRHAQDDLEKTTNILDTDLAAKCSGEGCRTSDITLSEFLSLQGTQDGTRPGTVVSHAQSIALLRDLGVKFTPELKSPAVEMPFDGMSQRDYAQALVDEYIAAGIAPGDVWLQSFNLDDVRYWIEAAPEFGAQAVFLDAGYRADGWSPQDPETWAVPMEELAAMGLRYIAPPVWVLLALEDGKIVPSVYATEAKAAGLEIITWTLERSGDLSGGGGWYFQSVTEAVTDDGVLYEVLDVLARDVGVVGVFSDWAGTVSYYASCMGLE